MAQKEIKSFTIGTDTGKIDYVDGIVNKPTVYGPNKVNLAWSDTNVTKVETYRYAGHENIDEDPLAISTGTILYARDGEFGNVTIDEPWRATYIEPGKTAEDAENECTGQVNLGITLADTYDTVVPTVSDATAYKNFKTPYLTCRDGIYRFTKIVKDFNVTALTAGKESDLTGTAVTFKIVTPEGYSGSAPVVKQYRTNDAMFYRATSSATDGYKPETLTFTSGSCVSKAYSKDTGYPDNSENDAAQVNFTVDWTTVEGYTLGVSATSGKYKNFNTPATQTGWTNQYQLTKLKNVTAESPLEITVAIAAPASVTYANGTTIAGANGHYHFCESDTPATVALGSDLEFKFWQQADESDLSEAPSTAVALAKISSITVGGTAITLTESLITKSGKGKVTVVVPGAQVTGNIVVTLAELPA